MTADARAHQDRDDLFVADFYPQLGEYLAEQHAAGYDTGAGQARFLAWLSEHAEAAAAADPVRDYLKQIGKVPGLNAEQEVELAKRIEAGRQAEQRLAEEGPNLSTGQRIDWSGSPRTAPGPRTTCWRRTCGWWCRWPSGTPGGACCSWT